MRRLVTTLIAVVLMGQGMTLLAVESHASRSTQGGSVEIAPRLSWAPTDYLRRGFRNAPWVRDPFFPEVNSFHLSGVISDEMAFINGKWFRQGDKLEGYEVKSISPQGVTLIRRGEVLVLKITE